MRLGDYTASRRFFTTGMPNTAGWRLWCWFFPGSCAATPLIGRWTVAHR